MAIEQALTNTAANQTERPIRPPEDYKGMYRDLSKIFYDPTGQGKEGDDELMQTLNEIKERIEKGNDGKDAEKAKQELRELYLEWCVGQRAVRDKIEKKLEEISKQMIKDYHTKWLRKGPLNQKMHIINEYKKLCEEAGVDYDAEFITKYLKEQHGF